MSHDLLIIRTTDEPLESVCQRIPEVSQKHQFGVLGVHDLKQKMESKGIAFGRECRVFEVCNPSQAQKVLSRAIEVSSALPCRIAVYVEDGRTTLASIKPSALVNMYSRPEIASVAQEVEATLVQIMDELATPAAVPA